jgi:uncharacterized protein DUF1259
MSIDRKRGPAWHPFIASILFALLCQGLAPISQAQAVSNTQSNWQAQVNSIMGWQGERKSEGVLRFTLTPQVQLKIAGIRTLPNLALDGFAAFRQESNGVLVVAEIAVPDEKLDAVWRVAEAHGLEISAIHNHVVLETPPMKFVHCSGFGNAAALARAVKLTLSATGLSVSKDEDKQDKDDVAPGLNVSALDAALHANGKPVDGVLEYTFDRSEQFMLQGHPLPPAMGPESEINFQSLGKGHSVVIAEFALLPTELEKVVQLVRTSDQKVTISALHNHFVGEEPRLYFVHLAGLGDPVKLSQLLGAAIKMTAQSPSE